MNGEVVIVSAARTAIGRFQGSLSTIPAPQLGGIAIAAAVERAGIEGGMVDEVLMGNVISAGLGQAPARQAALKAGLPPTVGATTVNKICASGLKTAVMAMQAIRAGDAQIMVAGGMENMTRGPYLLLEARTGYRLGYPMVETPLVDATVYDGLWCSLENWHMGMSAEFIAEQYNITRQELDEYSLKSHQKALKAIEEGKFKAEIAPVTIPQRKGEPLIFDTDETPRPDTSLEALAKLGPAFKEDGIVTAGNSPGLTDGAAAVVVMSAEKAEELGLQPLARITGWAQAAVEPKWLFIAPAYAIRKLLERTGYQLDDFELIEINEAFAAQVLADGKELGWDWDRVNVNGGAIALGHPIGCSGARVLVTLLYAMRDRGAKVGLAALCLGGGEAVAMSVERV
jgi:acetyl-CoA C-acetyltransferase